MLALAAIERSSAFSLNQPPNWLEYAPGLPALGAGDSDKHGMRLRTAKG